MFEAYKIQRLAFPPYPGPRLLKYLSIGWDKMASRKGVRCPKGEPTGAQTDVSEATRQCLHAFTLFLPYPQCFTHFFFIFFSLATEGLGVPSPAENPMEEDWTVCTLL